MKGETLRLNRQQIENLYNALQDVAADTVELEVRSDGKLHVSLVETIEKLRPLAISKSGRSMKTTELAKV